MTPSVDERLASIVRSLTDVVLPALPSGAGLAQEQVQLAIGHLQLLRAQIDATPAFEADELADAVALAGALTAIDRTAMAGPLQAAIAAAEGAATPAAVREARIAVNAAIHAAIAAAPAKGPVRDALDRCVIAAETVRSAKDRRWFAPFGFDPAPPGE